MTIVKLGIFVPKRMDTLRPEVAPLIGMAFKFRYAWTMDEDDPYPGQVAWFIDPDDQERFGLTNEQRGWWYPDEDIHDLGARPAAPLRNAQ
jgi:hypothetical protein